MAKITELTKRVQRQVLSIDRGLIVTLFPGGVLGLRPKRTKRQYTIHLQTCYQLAVLQFQNEKKRQKAAERKAARKARRS